MPKVGANIRTSFVFSPKGSNIVLLALVCILAVCLIAGFIFLWYKHEFSWVPFSVASILLVVIVPFWSISRKDIDYSSSVPTRIETNYGQNAIAVTTDSRGMNSSDFFRLLEQCVSIAQHHRPLPEPDGLVDASGNQVPNSEGEARVRVRTANDQVQKIVDSVTKHSNYPDEEVLEQRGSSDENGRISNSANGRLMVERASVNRLVDED